MNLQKAWDHYKWLVDYCDRHKEDAEKHFSKELPLCREMVDLLPYKMQVTGQQQKATT